MSLQSNHEQIADKPKPRGIYKIHDQVLPQIIKIVRDKERNDRKEREVGRPDDSIACGIPAGISKQEKVIGGKTNEIWIKLGLS